MLLGLLLLLGLLPPPLLSNLLLLALLLKPLLLCLLLSVLLEDDLREEILGRVHQEWSAGVEVLLDNIGVVEAELVADIVVNRVDNTKLISASLNSLRVAYSIFVVWGKFDGPLYKKREALYYKWLQLQTFNVHRAVPFIFKWYTLLRYVFGYYQHRFL